MRWGHEKPSPKVASSPWFLVQTLQRQDLIIVGDRTGAHVMDISQTLKFARMCSNKDAIYTITPHGQHFLFRGVEAPRPLHGLEAMALQAIPWPSVRDVDAWDSHQLIDLAGNAFTGTIPIVLMMVVFSHMSFKTALEIRADSEEACSGSQAMTALLRGRK